MQHTPETEAPVEEPDENESLAVTGGETAWGVVAGGLRPPLAGGVLMAVRRQSRLSYKTTLGSWAPPRDEPGRVRESIPCPARKAARRSP